MNKTSDILRFFQVSNQEEGPVKVIKDILREACESILLVPNDGMLFERITAYISKNMNYASHAGELDMDCQWSCVLDGPIVNEWTVNLRTTRIWDNYTIRNDFSCGVYFTNTTAVSISEVRDDNS